MTGRIVELVKGKKYKVIVEAGKHPETGERRRITRVVNGRKIEAEKLRASITLELEHGTYIEPSKETLAEYLDHWLKTYAINKAPSTYNGYKRIVEKHLKPQIGHIPLLKLQPMQVQEYYSNRLLEGRLDGKGGLSPNTVIRHHALLREALEHAVKWQKIYRNPADLTEPPSAEETEIFPLDQDELDRLLAAASGERDEYLYIFAAYGGMREGELLALRWMDTDLGGKPRCRVQQTVGYIPKKGFVFRPTAKSKKARREIPLLDIAKDALKKQRVMVVEEQMKAGSKYNRKYNLVFPNKFGNPMDPSQMTRKFKALAVELGFPDTRFHDLRHTHATMLLEMGIHPKIVQERLGHQTIGMTMDRYSHVLQGMQWEVIDRINQHLKNRDDDQNGTKTAPDQGKGRP